MLSASAAGEAQRRQSVVKPVDLFKLKNEKK